MKENYKLIVAYDGSRYFGFEKQKDQEATIQGKLGRGYFPEFREMKRE